MPEYPLLPRTIKSTPFSLAKSTIAVSTDAEVTISAAFDSWIFFSLALTFISSNHSFTFCLVCSTYDL
jgi:hypothetical protein